MTHRLSVAASTHPQEPHELKRQLRERLLALSYHGFLHCLRRLLLRMGYSKVQTLGRTLHKGHNEDGGADLSASVEAGLLSQHVIVQAKQWEHSVQKRCVDELRGVMLRTGAKQGILVTTSTFSEVAREAAKAGDIAPVRLVDGDELATLLIDYSVGIQHRNDGSSVIDEAFFQSMIQAYPIPAPPSMAEKSKAENRKFYTASETACRLPIHIEVIIGKEGK